MLKDAEGVTLWTLPLAVEVRVVTPVMLTTEISCAAAAAEAAKAKVDLDRSTAMKNVKRAPGELAQQFQYDLAMDFDRAARSATNDADRAKFEARRDEIIKALTVKTTSTTIDDAIAEAIEGVRLRQNLGDVR